jgi:undecaprenyl-diphosphatase
MNFLQAVALGFIQGLTEFLPVSSSGHLVLGQKLFGILKPPILFDVMVHIGTLLSVLFYFKKRFLKINFRLLFLIFTASVPAGIVGLFLNNFIEEIFNSSLLVGFSLLFTAFLLLLTKNLKKQGFGFEKLAVLSAFVVGIFQSLAILPGISRSGSTIVGSRMVGLKRSSAFLFSFYIAVPAMLGALVLQLPGISKNMAEFNFALIGMFISFFVGLLALKILEKVLLKGKLFYFAYYCLGLGLLVVLGNLLAF